MATGKWGRIVDATTWVQLKGEQLERARSEVADMGWGAPDAVSERVVVREDGTKELVVAYRFGTRGVVTAEIAEDGE